MDQFKELFSGWQDSFKGLSRNQIIAGVVLGFFFSPIIAIIWAIVFPILILLAIAFVGGAIYAKVKLKATMTDLIMFVRILVPRVKQILAAKRNWTTDVWWYQCYNSVEKDKAFIVYANDDMNGEEEITTYYDMERLSNQIANWALAQKWQANTTVGLFMPNRPEFVAVWLGNAKIGVRTALLNHNLRRDALKHSIETGECKAIIYDSELSDALFDIKDSLNDVALYAWDGTEDDANRINASLLSSELAKSPSIPIQSEFRAVSRGANVNEPFLYIYTSGTTGKPKASKISHYRFRLAGSTFAALFAFRSTDRIYCPLPLYHSAGGMLGCGITIDKGATLVLRKKFSTSKFALDCYKYNVTAIQYIGELARYLLSSKETPKDKQLSIRIAMGNGLRPDVWKQFKERYNIKQIAEFYGATEGASALLNVANVDYSIGYMSPVFSKIIPMAIVKFDIEKEEPIRGADGKLILCKDGEPGEFIAKIKKQFGVSNYSGYTNKAASDKKVIHNAFEDGDSWFRSGDLLKKDEFGNCFFVDRIGDTFRWKGENVATSDVSHALSTFDSIPEANVYGVLVPHHDGRAGMASIVGANIDEIDFSQLAKHLKKELPKYAIPLFLRFLPALELTSTFKHKKVDLRNQGFDKKQVSEPLFFFDGKTYVELSDEIYQKIEQGDIKL